MSDYHWTPEAMRRFVETIAETGNVSAACRATGKSRASAYALARRADGVAFKYGWAAARLLARDVVADELMERALEGSRVETIRDPDTNTTTRVAHDRALGMALLTRLDKQTRPLQGAEIGMASIISSHFEEFLTLMEAGANARDVEEFIITCDYSCEQIHCQLGLKTANFNSYGERIKPPVEYKSMPEPSPRSAPPIWHPKTTGGWRGVGPNLG